jgi:hypothetical protein
MTLALTTRPASCDCSAIVTVGLAELREDIDARRLMERSIRRQIQENFPYIAPFRGIRYTYRDGNLTIRGRLPSRYLKELLQTYLRNLVHDEQIRDEVEVISAARQDAIQVAG